MPKMPKMPYPLGTFDNKLNGGLKNEKISEYPENMESRTDRRSR